MKAAVGVFSAIALIACTGSAPGADKNALIAEPQSKYALTWREDGALELDAEVLTPNGCYFARGPAEIGTPDNVAPVAHSLAVQLPIGTESGVCTMALKYVPFKAVFKTVPVDTVVVIAYELWPKGDPVRPQALALPLQ